MLCHPSSHRPGWTGLEPGLPQKPVDEGWMVCPSVPETRRGQVTPWPGVLPVWAQHGDQCPREENRVWPEAARPPRPCSPGPGGVRRGPEQLQEPQHEWQMFPELYHSAGSSVGRDTGAQQKHRTQRFTPSQMQEGRKKKKIKKRLEHTQEYRESHSRGRKLRSGATGVKRSRRVSDQGEAELNTAQHWESCPH